MKLSLLFLLVFAWSAHADELARNRGKNVGRDFVLEQTLIEKVLEESKVGQRKSLRQAKFFLINGETELARAGLNQTLKSASEEFKPSLYRFLAVADFQDGNWKAALAHLSRPELTAYPNYSRICLLKIVLRVAVKETYQLDKEWERCKYENKRDAQFKDMVWMEALVAFASRKPGAGKSILGKYNPLNLSNDDLKVILKLSLYLNLESTMVASLEALDYSVVQDEELRGLIAHIYFRQGRLADSWRLMEDVQSPNVDNMKGNLWILRNNSELAYAQFKLALKEKSNSHNAVERALPLAWFLQQWKDGIKLAERIYTHEKNTLQKSTTIAAFAVANGQWKEAFERLESVHQQGGEATAQEVSQLSTYVALRQDDRKRLKRYGSNTCSGGDLVACWILSSEFIWPELSTLLNQDASAPGLEAAIPLDKELLTDTSAFKDEGLIDQRDIDELDDSLIQLAKSP
jgi:predicted negative regulator of RcsB-dependent stress response